MKIGGFQSCPLCPGKLKLFILHHRSSIALWFLLSKSYFVVVKTDKEVKPTRSIKFFFWNGNRESETFEQKASFKIETKFLLNFLKSGLMSFENANQMIHLSFSVTNLEVKSIRQKLPLSLLANTRLKSNLYVI